MLLAKLLLPPAAFSLASMLAQVWREMPGVQLNTMTAEQTLEYFEIKHARMIHYP